jgi:hypothetical protein
VNNPLVFEQELAPSEPQKILKLKLWKIDIVENKKIGKLKLLKIKIMES